MQADSAAAIAAFSWPTFQQVVSLLQLAALVFTALFTALAARAAVNATRISRRLQEDEALSRRLSHQEAYYRAMVVDPVMRELRAFIETVRPPLTDGLLELQKLGREDQMKLFDDAVESITGKFKPAYLEFRENVQLGVIAWDSSELSQDITNALDDLEDQVMNQLDGIAYGRREGDVVQQLTLSGSDIMRVVRKHHPSLVLPRESRV